MNLLLVSREGVGKGREQVEWEGRQVGGEGEEELEREGVSR
jgi:hypothetical protein